jgi:hypothetical protein
MTVATTTTKEASTKWRTPAQIMNKYADEHYCLELLRFFGTYPSTRFSELAVIHALNDDSEKSRIRSALGRLVIDGAVAACIENGTHLYKLTDDESVCSSVVYLAKTDWHQWRIMLER